MPGLAFKLAYGPNLKVPLSDYCLYMWGYMQSERNLVKKILYAISGLEGKDPDLTDIEIIYEEERVIGYRIMITANDRPRLKLIKHEDRED